MNESRLAGSLLRPTRNKYRLRQLSAMIGPLLMLFSLGATGHANAQSCAVGEASVAFGFTGGEQHMTVPAGVTSLTVHLSGAQGGSGLGGAGTIAGSPDSPGGSGGLGGRIRGTLAVIPGAALSIFVGGQASQEVNPGGLGFGPDGIGGGATDLRVGGNSYINRVAIAGGGGGGGNAGWSSGHVVPGGAGGAGGFNGGTGNVGGSVPGGDGPFGGGGGMLGTGGPAGAGCSTFPATAGNAATGHGGSAMNFAGSFDGAGFGGGGGGGATIGAGGGGGGVGTVAACQTNWNGGGGGGAGGSSAAFGISGIAVDNGVQAGNGAALICYYDEKIFANGFD